MVGDRQATAGYIASRDVRKIEPADHFTAIAISGTAARGMEFISSPSSPSSTTRR